MPEFRVYGLPAPGGSKKGFVNPRDGRVIIKDDCKRNGTWMDRVAGLAVDHFPEPLTGPIGFKMTFILPRPKGHFGTGRNAGIVKPSAPPYPTAKPDTTKLIRSTEDALRGIAWGDDAQVVDQGGHKRYGPRPGVIIDVWQIEVPEPAPKLAKKAKVTQ